MRKKRSAFTKNRKGSGQRPVRDLLRHLPPGVTFQGLRGDRRDLELARRTLVERGEIYLARWSATPNHWSKRPAGKRDRHA